MKRSSKKYRNQKKKDQKKKLLATGMMVCLGTFPVWSNDNVLLTIIPGMSKAFGSNLGIDYDYGVGAKLTYRKGDNLDFFLEADYKRLSLPNVSPIDLVNVNAGAGYHFNFNERFGLNVSAQAGAYMGSKSGGMVTGPSGGISVSFTYRINPVVSVEAGANVGHYAATPTPLMTEVGGTAAVTLNLTEAMTNVSRIKMETNEMLPVFPVLYSWYKNNAFATVGITNQEDAAIEDVTVSFYQSQYMNQPNVCKKIPKLGKGETIDAELTAFFNERMLDLTEKTDTEATVIIEYSYLGRKKKKEIGMVVPVYGRNSMSWDDDRRAAVFVSSKDPAALWFSKYISSIVRDNARPESLGNNYPGVSQNIQYAMGIFETLDQFGLNYVIDPSSAYSDNIGGASIDFLQFPYQTLTYRGGDCDDISILVCSLFEAVGIKTGFITIPGHIFIAFDSGMTMQEAGQSMMNTSNLFDMKGDGEAWIPLEITLTDEGFSRAWKVGAREWSTTAEGDRMFYAMEDCWKLYDPVSVPGATANFTLPDKNVVTRLFQHSMDNWIAKEISPIVAQYNARLAMNDTVELRNELGILYGQYGLFVEADDQFKRARRKGYVPSLLNTANIYFARKQFQIALEWYRQVLEKEPENNLAILGVARCQYELENFDECDLAYDWLRNKNPELANEYRYLGAFEQTTGRSYSLADRLTLTKWDRGEYSSGIVNDGSYEEIAEANSREDENGFVTSDATSSTLVDSETEQLFTQIADMTNPDSALRPDAAIVDTKTYDRVPTDRYASLDDPATLVQELPGLIAQLRLPETKFDNTDPVMISDYQLIASTSTGGKPVTDTSSSIIVEERPSTAQTTTTPKTDSVPHVAETKTETLPFVTTTVPETKPEEKPSVDTNKLGRKEVVAVVPKTTETSIAEQKPSSTTSTTGTSETTVVESASTVETPVEIVQTHVEEKAPVAEQKPSSTTATTGTTVVESTGSVETPVEIAQTHVEEKAPVAEQKPSSTTSTTGTTETTVVESASTVEAPVEIAQTHVEEKTPIVEQNPSSTNTSTETTVAESTSSVETPVEIAQTHVEEKAPIVEQKPSSTTSTTGTTETTVAESASTVEPPVEIAQTHVEEKAPIVEQKPSSTNISTETTVVESASTVETPVELAQTHVEDETPVVEQKPSSTNTSTETTVVESASSVETPVELAQTHVEEKAPIAEQKPSSTNTSNGTTGTTHVEQTSTVETPVEIAQTHVEETTPIVEQKPTSTTGTTETTVAESTSTVETPVELAQTHVEEKAPVVEQKPSSTNTSTGTTVAESAGTVETPVELAQTHVEEKTPIAEQKPSSTTATTETTVAESASTVETPVEIAQTHVEENAPVAEQKPSSTNTSTGTTGTTVVESASTVETPVEIAQTHVEETTPIVEQKPSSTNTSTGTTETTAVESTGSVETPVEIAQTHVEEKTSVVEQKLSSTNTSTGTTETTVVESASSVETPVELAQTHVEEKTPIAEQKPSSTNTSTATTGTTHVEQTSSVETPVEVAQTHVEEKTPIVEQKPSSTNTGTEETPLVTVETVVEEPQIDEWENDFFEAVVNTPNEKKEDKPAVAVNLYEDDPDVEEWNDWDDWDDDELFDALMNPPNFDDFAGTPIASLKNDDIIEDIKTASELFNTDKGSEVAIGPSLPKDEIIERAAPRYTETETSKWVPDEVYQAKTIPGMKTFEEEMALYSDDKSWLYEEEPERLSDDTEDAIALELWKEAQAQAKIEEKKKAEESFGQNIETLEDLASMFSYLDDNVLEEIQHTTLIDKINEQAAKKMDPTAKAKNNDEEILEEIRRMREEKEAEEKAEREAEKHSRPNVGLLHKAEQISSTVSEPDEKIEQPVENLVHEQEHIANLVEEMEPTKLEEVSNVGLDIDTKEKTKFNAGPYIAGGLGLVGLFVLFLLIFVKRDDDDDDDKKKKEGPANA
ncbi:MAG: hypothetical protein IKP60_02760 [Treponema sp.]|nr:hypothetical protein [Treponema sp.]